MIARYTQNEMDLPLLEKIPCSCSSKRGGEYGIERKRLLTDAAKRGEDYGYPTQTDTAHASA
jgi:hypothetical protein